MFIGWGKKNKTWELTDGRVIMATWRYFDLFFCPFAYGIKWHLLGENRKDDKIIPYDEVEKLFPSDDIPKISIWNRYGLFMGIAVLVLISMFLQTTK